MSEWLTMVVDEGFPLAYLSLGDGIIINLDLQGLLGRSTYSKQILVRVRGGDGRMPEIKLGWYGDDMVGEEDEDDGR